MHRSVYGFFTWQAHAQVWILQTFRETIEEQDDAGVKRALTSLFRLYAVSNIMEKAGDFLEVRNTVISTVELPCIARYFTLGESRLSVRLHVCWSTRNDAHLLFRPVASNPTWRSELRGRVRLPWPPAVVCAWAIWRKRVREPVQVGEAGTAQQNWGSSLCLRCDKWQPPHITSDSISDLDF